MTRITPFLELKKPLVTPFGLPHQVMKHHAEQLFVITAGCLPHYSMVLQERSVFMTVDDMIVKWASYDISSHFHSPVSQQTHKIFIFKRRRSIIINNYVLASCQDIVELLIFCTKVLVLLGTNKHLICAGIYSEAG